MLPARPMDRWVVRRTAAPADRVVPGCAAPRRERAATRKDLPVELVLHGVARNLDLDSLLAEHPELTADDVKACLVYAADAVRERRHRRPAARAWGIFAVAAKLSFFGHL